MFRSLRTAVVPVLLAVAALPVRAHEAYVVDTADFWQAMAAPISPHALDALRDPANVRVSVFVTFGIIVALTLNFLFRRSEFGLRAHKAIEKLHFIGPHLVRATIAIALFLGAISDSFLGPEIAIGALPFGAIAKWVLIASSIAIALGFLTELAALLGLLVFGLGFFAVGAYMFTYFNYFGELLVLALFGMRVFSVDRILFGPLKRFTSFEKYETTIVRVCYGFALLFAGISVKFLHPDLTTGVVEHWHLTQFTWLFPSDPLLVTFGGGLAEAAIGLFIIFGFEMRLTVLISLFYITLSLMYFRELVWPHLLLYGISLNLLVQPEVFTIDHILFEEHRNDRHWWHRPFLPHKKRGKTEHAEEFLVKQ